MRRVCAVSVVAGLILITGCATAGTDSPTVRGSEDSKNTIRPRLGAAQLIIKFSSAVTDPSQAEFVDTLSKDIGVSLAYLRPMSGGAHVFIVKGAPDSRQLQDISRRLSKRSDVIYAEPDRIMRHQ